MTRLLERSSSGDNDGGSHTCSMQPKQTNKCEFHPNFCCLLVITSEPRSGDGYVSHQPCRYVI
jgi:hypothetical protein